MCDCYNTVNRKSIKEHRTHICITRKNRNKQSAANILELFKLRFHKITRIFHSLNINNIHINNIHTNIFRKSVADLPGKKEKQLLIEIRKIVTEIVNHLSIRYIRLDSDNNNMMRTRILKSLSHFQKPKTFFTTYLFHQGQ